jgi:hypothetical protein
MVIGTGHFMPQLSGGKILKIPAARDIRIAALGRSLFHRTNAAVAFDGQPIPLRRSWGGKDSTKMDGCQGLTSGDRPFRAASTGRKDLMMSVTKSGQPATKPAAKAAAQQQAKAPPKDPAAKHIASEEADKKTVLEETAEANAAQKAAEKAEAKPSTIDVLHQQQIAEGPTLTEPPTEAPEEAEDEQMEKDISTDEADVVAHIGEIDRTGKIELLTGTRAYMKSRNWIGEVLETNFGGKDRQERGKRVIQEVSRRYGISTSELYRCWKFYKLRPNFDGFCEEFPTVTSWTAVKDLLPILESGGNVEAKRKKNKDQALIERIQDDLKALREGLAADLKGNVPPNELRKLADQLQKTGQEVVALVITVGQRFDAEGKPIAEE